MGREIRRVPANWQHPKKQMPDYRTSRMVEQYQPLFDEPFAPRMREWYAGWDAWERGERPKGAISENYFDWDGGPPDPEYYRPDWKEEEMTWFQVYETVSEGTPVSPPFATEEELIEYLAINGDFWDQLRAEEGRQAGPAAWGREAAERFVKSRWTPTMIITNGQVLTARDGI
jgi:hypothetical protein